MMEVFFKSFLYVIGANFFWASMGFTVATAMFMGAMIYDGHMKQLSKGVVTIISYMALLLLTTSSRILPIFQSGTLSLERQAMALAGVATIILVTAFWALGLFIGVTILKNKPHSPTAYD